jgi:hypothetical protein
MDGVLFLTFFFLEINSAYRSLQKKSNKLTEDKRESLESVLALDALCFVCIRLINREAIHDALSIKMGRGLFSEKKMQQVVLHYS